VGGLDKLAMKNANPWGFVLNVALGWFIPLNVADELACNA
jgi:hypothetical protein